MQIFEFQFNPKSKNQRIETFSHEPNNGDGNLYLIGEIRNIMPGNENLLGKIMKMMKDEYVSSPPTNAFRRSLVKVNKYLAAEVAKNNVSWLGNLHLGALSISKKKVEMAKIGKISAFLIGNKKVEELNDQIKERETDNNFQPRAFGTLISGKIGIGERMAVLTEDLLSVFLKSEILKEISGSIFLDRKSIEKLIEERKNELSKISGAFLLIDTRDISNKKKPFPSGNEIDFSIKEVIAPVKKTAEKIFSGNEKHKLFIKLPEIKIRDEYKKGLFLVFLMAILLISGFFIFQAGEKKRVGGLIIKLEQMEKILPEVDVLISSGKNREAFSLLVNIYREISYIGDPIFDDTKREVVLRLETISGVERIDPEKKPILKFEIDDFVPQRVIAIENRAFFYSPFSERIVEVDLSTMQKKYHSVFAKPNSAAIFNGKLAFFSKPDKIFLITNEIVELERLILPHPEADLGGLITFAGNFYLRDSVSGLIIKYESVDAKPEKWFASETEKPADIRSMSTDGFIWLLNFENKISKYHLGKHIKDISLEIFPFVRSISRISTSSVNPHLFLLEPAENRVIIVDKQGRPIKQIISDRFNNLIDFWVSDDGENIILLNGLEVYQISI